MKYLLNTLFIALFIVTVGCSNELTGFDSEINPISETAAELHNMQQNGNAATGFTSHDGSSLTTGGGDLLDNDPEYTTTGGGGDQDDDTVPDPEL